MKTKVMTGRFFNNRTRRTTPEGYVLRSTRERLEYEGYSVFWTWGNVPDEYMSATKAKKNKVRVAPNVAAYVEDEFHWITALYCRGE